MKTRTRVLAHYRQVRAGIQDVLKAAAGSCTKADLVRAIKQIAPWASYEDLGNEDIAVRLADVALFEPNQRDRRAYDRFLASQDQMQFDFDDLPLAGRMGKAWFSIFHVTAPHEVAGLWLEDVLDGDRHIWIVDEGLEASAFVGDRFGMRLFDAGLFHAGFGIVAVADDETIATCVAARGRGSPSPFRHSIAATLYADELQVANALTDQEWAEATGLVSRFLQPAAGSVNAAPKTLVRRKRQLTARRGRSP